MTGLWKYIPDTAGNELIPVIHTQVCSIAFFSNSSSFPTLDTNYLLCLVYFIFLCKLKKQQKNKSLQNLDIILFAQKFEQSKHKYHYRINLLHIQNKKK